MWNISNINPYVCCQYISDIVTERLLAVIFDNFLYLYMSNFQLTIHLIAFTYYNIEKWKKTLKDLPTSSLIVPDGLFNVKLTTY
jgi:hypothetical protein